MPKSHSSLVSTHSTVNLVGPCNTHPNTQSHKSTKIRYIRSDHWHMSYANERRAPASSQEQNKDTAKAKGEAPNGWASDQLKTRNLSAVNLKKMPHRWVDTWARDVWCGRAGERTVTWLPKFLRRIGNQTFLAIGLLSYNKGFWWAS